MSDKLFDSLLDKALSKAGEAGELAYMLYQVMEGDVPDDIYETLHKYGYVNDDYEWKYGDDDA
jgi:hypothetical protein